MPGEHNFEDVKKDMKETDNVLNIAWHGLKEDHNPLDIPFGHEVNEINMNVKDKEPVEEGGMGSGRNPEEGPNTSAGTGQGPLISFGETIFKEFVDAKLSCPCNKKN